MHRTVQTGLTVICGIALVLSLFGLHPAIPYIAVIAGCPFAVMAGWEAIKDRRIDVNVLMILAAAGSIALGHTTEAAVLLFLFSLSSTLEEFAMARTRDAIEGLVKLRPDTALLVTPEGDATVAVTDVKRGDRIRILAFQQIPLDAVVVEGESSVNQAAMTGESIPVDVSRGTKLLSGTQNLDGMLVAEVSAPIGDTTLEKIVALVRDAQENKASGERISQWFGQRYTLFVIFASLVSVFLRLAFHEEFNRALYASLTLLVALSPCALVISTPASTLSALAWAAKNGMLIRGGEFIELAGQADKVAMDKTGTLTVGKPVLEEICLCSKTPVLTGSGATCSEEHACWSGGPAMSVESKSILRAAAAAEQYSTHPIAEAIVAAAYEHAITVPEAKDQTVAAGMGVTAIVDGKSVKIGQQQFFDGLPVEFLDHTRTIQSKGMTVAIVEHDGHLAALGLRDAPRPEAASVLTELKGLGLGEVSMLSGDNQETAKSVADEVGITEVRAGLLPDQKVIVIEELSKGNKGVIFVGDGVNDAPSLARASVGIAMGGLGSDIALNSADVVFMQDNLRRLPDLIRLGRRTNGVIRGNLIFAAGIIAILTIGSVVFDFAFPQHRNLILPFAVVGHEGSTLVVILSGLRLLSGPKKVNPQM